MADLGVWTVDGDAPQSVTRSTQVDLEKHLDDWIVADPTLLPGDLKIVGRQVKLDGGQLDLLAIDQPDRWVVVEIKRAQLYREALAQALDYTSSMVGLTSSELESKLQPGLAKLGDEATLASAVREQLEAESDDAMRYVDVMLVGVGSDPALDRMAEYLGSFGIQITVVSFEVFERDGGPRLLVREVEKQVSPNAPQPKRTLDSIRQRAVEAGVEVQFDRFVRMAEEASLYVQPVTRSVRFKAPMNKSWTLLFATPQDRGMSIGVRSDTFAEFYPPLTALKVEQALPLGANGTQLTGGDVDAWLDRIEAFLRTLPRGDGAADDA